MKFELSTTTTEFERAFAKGTLELFCDCPAPPASKQIAVLLAGKLFDTLIYPGGSHADVLSHATWLHAKSGFITEAAVVSGKCTNTGCPCDGGGVYITMWTLSSNGEQRMAGSKCLPDNDLEGVLANIPALLHLIRSLSATAGTLDANHGFDA
jgi:hypothetical protein